MLRTRTHLKTTFVLLLTASLFAGLAGASTVTVHLAGHASNDGDTPAYVADQGGENVTVTADTDGNVDVEDANPVLVLRGLAAYAGFVSDGMQGGTAGIWGQVAVDGDGCAFQTWGGDVEPGLVPSTDCTFLP